MFVFCMLLTQMNAPIQFYNTVSGVWCRLYSRLLDGCNESRIHLICDSLECIAFQLNSNPQNGLEQLTSTEQIACSYKRQDWKKNCFMYAYDCAASIFHIIIYPSNERKYTPNIVCDIITWIGFYWTPFHHIFTTEKKENREQSSKLNSFQGNA